MLQTRKFSRGTYMYMYMDMCMCMCMYIYMYLHVYIGVPRFKLMTHVIEIELLRQIMYNVHVLYCTLDDSLLTSRSM